MNAPNLPLREPTGKILCLKIMYFPLKTNNLEEL